MVVSEVIKNICIIYLNLIMYTRVDFILHNMYSKTYDSILRKYQLTYLLKPIFWFSITFNIFPRMHLIWFSLNFDSGCSTFPEHFWFPYHNNLDW